LTSYGDLGSVVVLPIGQGEQNRALSLSVFQKPFSHGPQVPLITVGTPPVHQMDRYSN